MFCKNCGTQINESAKFCTNCGAKIESSAEINKNNISDNSISDNVKSNDSKIENITNNESNQDKNNLNNNNVKKKNEDEGSAYQAKSDVKYLEEYEQFVAAFFGITGSLDKKKNKLIEGYSNSFKFYDSKPNIFKFFIRFGGRDVPFYDMRAILSCIFLIPFAYLYSLGAKKSAIISGIIVALIISLVMIAPAGGIWIIWLPFMCIVFFLMPKFFHVEFSKRMKLVENESDHNAKLEKFKSMCQSVDKKKEKIIAAVSFAAVVVFFFISAALFSGSFDGKYVKLVKQSSFKNLPQITVGELIKGTIKNAEWSEGVGEDDGINYVNVRGDLMGFDVLIQFRINQNEDGWVVNAVEMDGEAQPIGNLSQDLYNIYIGKEALKEYF
ncbi:zinc ribbon domain-containing protein [Brachyspira pilosicoli]|uniref:zinc ribbon domain-containing protein n=1 Tax=Brachyspira pilosicoli TaxID=52584 RepID=UPI00255C4DF7|nr:zinc ribbon domain-containing protein [Brachyspira pilosicoli]